MTHRDDIIQVLEHSELPMTSSAVARAIGDRPSVISSVICDLNEVGLVVRIDRKGIRGGWRYGLKKHVPDLHFVGIYPPDKRVKTDKQCNYTSVIDGPAFQPSGHRCRNKARKHGYCWMHEHMAPPRSA